MHQSADDGGYFGLSQVVPGRSHPADCHRIYEGDYALLVLISEAHGDFVGDTLRAIGERHANYAILVVKPMLTI